jgi:hypothetical protein
LIVALLKPGLDASIELRRQIGHNTLAFHTFVCRNDETFNAIDFTSFASRQAQNTKQNKNFHPLDSTNKRKLNQSSD